MVRDRLLPIAGALLAVLALASAATVLESASIASPYGVPAESDGGAGLSILGVLYLLLAALLEAVGLEIPPLGGGAPGPAVDGLVAALSLLRSIALPLLAVGAGTIVLVLVGRRLPESTGAGLDRLTALLRSTETRSRSSSTAEEWPPAEPNTDVTEAWVAMTGCLEVERPRSRTPGEWRDAAVRAGFDEDAVAALTDTFRAVRYGDASETAARRRRAKRELEALEADIE